MNTKTAKILEIQKQLAEANIDTSNLLYCPEVPLLGIEKSYVIEEINGFKVACLISVEEEKKWKINTNFIVPNAEKEK